MHFNWISVRFDYVGLKWNAIANNYRYTSSIRKFSYNWCCCPVYAAPYNVPNFHISQMALSICVLIVFVRIEVCTQLSHVFIVERATGVFVEGATIEKMWPFANAIGHRICIAHANQCNQRNHIN